MMERPSTRSGLRTSSEVEVRRMAMCDLEAVMVIEWASFPEPWSRAMFVSECDGRPFSYPSVAVQEDTVVGYVSCLAAIDALHLMNLAVSPAHRRQGIGGALLRWALAVGRDQGIRTAVLEVRAGNEAAQALYEKLGFYQIAVRPAYYSRPSEPAYVMVADIMPFGQEKI